MRNTLVMYDRQNEKIGFWKTNCSELWDRLQADGAPATAPPPLSNTTNLTPDIAPALPPLPGVVQELAEVLQKTNILSYNLLICFSGGLQVKLK